MPKDNYQYTYITELTYRLRIFKCTLPCHILRQYQLFPGQPSVALHTHPDLNLQDEINYICTARSHQRANQLVCLFV